MAAVTKVVPTMTTPYRVVVCALVVFFRNICVNAVFACGIHMFHADHLIENFQMKNFVLVARTGWFFKN